MACSCSNVRIPCSGFCGYQDSCENKRNLRDLDIDDNIESDEDSENGNDGFDDNYIYRYICISAETFLISVTKC